VTGGRDHPGNRWARAAAAAGALLLAACATVPPDAGKNPRDPYERLNRQTFAFNDRLDRYLMKPLAQGYQAVLPEGIRLCISNGFTNMLEIRNAVNDILQAKPVGAATDTGRLVINSTLGVAGCFDIATRMGLERRQEDFGLTLARWGLNTGPYLVLPVLGPSDVRDGIGLAPDAYASPIGYIFPVVDRNIVLGVSVVDTRATLLDATKMIEQVALDRYQFTRDAYLQRRTSLQYEGNPPAPPLEDDDSAPAGPAPDAAKTQPVQPAPEDRR
jgi:phospholipid-binding lipoprotein MlaA